MFVKFAQLYIMWLNIADSIGIGSCIDDLEEDWVMLPCTEKHVYILNVGSLTIKVEWFR